MEIVIEKQKYRMSYPTVGKIDGYYTETRFERIDNKEGYPILYNEPINCHFNNHGSPDEITKHVMTDSQLIEQQV